jgi:tellurite resistance protein TerC
MTGSMASPALWAGFVGFVIFVLALDLGVFHRKEHAVGAREATVWSIVWILLALVFAGGVFHFAGPAPAMEFLTGYVIEKALSVDNLFVFLVTFSVFRVPPLHQHRVLVWGVVGALVLRAVFVLAGSALLHRFHFLIYVFGAFLAFTGVKLLLERGDDGPDHGRIEHSRFVRLFRRLVPMSADYDGGRFFTRANGKLLATPLLLVLVVIEGTDLVFALDSVPAVLAVTKDPFVTWTSNVFAILGLRSLFFLLADALERFKDLKVGLALVLVFVGAKMALADVVPIPVGVSLGIVVALLAGSIVVSLARAQNRNPKPAEP